MGRRASPRVLFGYFLHDAKSDNPYSLRRELRGFANLDSAHRSDIFAPQQLKPFKEASRFSKPRISAHKQHILSNPIKSFCRFAASFGGKPPWRSLAGTFISFLSQKADQKGHQTDGLMPFSLFSQKPLLLKLLDKCVNIFFGKCRVNIVFGKQFIN